MVIATVLLKPHLVMRQKEIDPIYSYSPNYFELRDLYSLPREVVGYASYLGR